MKTKPSEPIGDVTLEFFGLTRFPFRSGVLRPPYDDLFLNRSVEVETIKQAVLRGSNSAVAGARGTGKSSLLYRVFAETSSSVQGSLIEFAFSPDTQSNRREFLHRIYEELLRILAKSPELAKAASIDPKLEIQRLGASVTVERLFALEKKLGAEIGGELAAGILEALGISPKVSGNVQGERSTQEQQGESIEWPILDESTLTAGIGRVCAALPRRVVFFVDELDKVGRPPLEFEGWDDEVGKLLELSRELMVHQQLTFVFTLQQEFLTRLHAARVGRGDPSLLGLIPVYMPVGAFDEPFARQYLEHALNLAGWARPVEGFLEPRAFRLIFGLSGGNPRLFSNYLEEVTSRAAIARIRPITPAVLWDTLKDALRQEYELEPEDWEALVAVAETEQGVAEGQTAHEEALKSLLRKGLLRKSRKRYVLGREA